MKRFFALVALVLGLASCQTEPEGLDVQMGGAVDATITVNIPDSETRAGGTNSAGSAFDNGIIANADYTVRYILQVFNEDGSASKDMMYKYSDDDTVAFDVRLVPGRDYRFVVWADIVNADGVQDGVKCADLHYVIGQTLQNITLAEPVGDDDKWAAMDETRDAYTGIYDSVEFSASENITLTLKRPFAKLRVITTDMNELFDNVSPHNAVVTYTTPHYDAFNAFSGVASGERTGETHTYNIADYADQTGANKVLLTDYFFANESGVVKFTMDVKEADGQSIKYNTFNTDIAVKRNYLTTISGNILTDGNKINVTVEDRFVDADGNNQHIDYKTISSDKEFLDAVNGDGGKYIVISDLTIADAGTTVNNGQAGTFSTRAAGNGTTINLNGYNITLKTNITIAEGKTLTITDINENGETGAIINAGGKIVNNGILNIEGGEFGKNTIENTQGGDVNITGGTFESDPSEFVDDDYNVVVNEDGSFDVEIKDVIATIGDVKYRTLQKAVNEAVNGDTITFVADVEQVDGVLITDKNLTIDLNDKTYTITEGANTNYRNFKVNGSSVVTIKNGSIVAQGELTSGAYGTVRTEGTAVVNLESVKLYSYRGYGLNVKARAGTTIKIKDSEIYAQYSGGVEAEGGNIELTNVKIDQTGVYSTGAWCSVAIGVNGGGEVTVNSGNYSASTISTDANAAQGTWVAYVMSSGGTLNIKGGTFNGVVAETASAANACGLICADTKAIVNIYGGTFSSNGAILDMRNNTGGTPNPSATLYAGTFSADPRVSGLYASNLIKVDSKSDIKEENGKWVVFVRPVAKIGETEYETLEAAVAAAQAGNTITLVEDVTLAEELEIPAGITLNGNGKQINGTIYAGGDLTFAGHTKVTKFSASYYNHVITIGEGACLEVTGTGRVTLGYGNTFNITGSIDNAKTADKANIQPSLIIPKGISITGGNDATMNVTDAYVKLGGTTSKPGEANGTFTLNFNNAIAEFTAEFGFYDPTGGVNPTFVMNIEDSVFTTGTKLYVTANSTVTVDNSNVPLGTYLANRGVFNLTNGSVMTGATIQFGENGGNNGAITVDASSLTITAGGVGHAFDGLGKGSITAQNGATVNVDYYKGMTINVDATSTFTGVDVDANKKIYYVSDEMALEPTNLDALGGAVVVSNVWDKTTGKGVITFDRDLTTIGEKAFQRVTNTTPSNWATSITLPNSVKTIGDYAFAQCYSLTNIVIPDGVTSIGQYAFQSCDAVTTVTIGSGVTTIGSGAFYNCYEIKEIICKSTTAPALADKWVFNGVDKAATVYVPTASVDTYKAADIWKDFTNIMGR